MRTTCGPQQRQLHIASASGSIHNERTGRTVSIIYITHDNSVSNNIILTAKAKTDIIIILASRKTRKSGPRRQPLATGFAEG